MRHRGHLAGSILLSTGLLTAAVAAPALAAGKKHVEISSVTTSLGRVVSSAKGQVMFRFMKDSAHTSSCSTACQAVWPPVTSPAKPTAGAHIAARHLGRTSGGQVTYYGHPLYFYVGDPKPGKTKGDGIKEFGGTWFVVSTTGKPVKPGGSTGASGPALPTGPAVVGTSAGTPAVITDNANGSTLYELSSDAPPAFGCTGGCLSVWPPLLTLGAPTAAGSADAAKLGVVSRTFATGTADQVTYNGHPVYTYTGDHAAGQANGEGKYEPPGGYWYDLGPDGMPTE